jgi:hypothetical protein
MYSSPAGKGDKLPPSPGDEEVINDHSPPDAEKERFASYYGASAEEAQLRDLKRGVVKFNAKPREVRRCGWGVGGGASLRELWPGSGTS